MSIHRGDTAECCSCGEWTVWVWREPCAFECSACGGHGWVKVVYRYDG